MLPFRTDVPECPIIQIDRTQSPPFPMVYDPRLNHLLTDIAVRIVNQCSIMAGKNPIRMFCFNMLSNHGWVNPFFEEVFLLCVTHIQMTLTRNQTTAETVYQSSVDMVLTLYASSLVFNYPDLKSVVSPQQIEASSQNSGLFNELKMEMNRMSGMGQPQQLYPSNQFYGYQQPGMPPPLVFDPRTGGYVPMNVPSVAYGRPGYPNVPYPGMSRMVPPDFAPRPDPTIRDYNSRGNQSQPKLFSDSINQQVGHRTHYDRNEPTAAARQDSYFEPKGPPSEPYEPEVFVVSKTETRPLPETGDSTMDRKIHEQVSGTVPPMIVMSPERHKPKEVEKYEIDITVISDVALHLDIDIPIAQFRVETIKNPDPPICRRYLFIPDVIVSLLPVQYNINHWVTTVEETLTSVSLNMQKAFNKTDGSTSEIAQMLTLLREFDQLLTKKVNDFLANKLDVTFIIESFIDDYQELPRFILQKVGAVGTKMLEQFERGIIDSFGSQFRSKKSANDYVTFSELVSQSDFLTVPNGVHVGYVPNTYSLTQIPIDRVELQIPISKKRFILDPDKQKIVFHTVKTLFDIDDPENVFETPIDHHILITKDGARYRVGKTFNRDEYYLKML